MNEQLINKSMLQLHEKQSSVNTLQTRLQQQITKRYGTAHAFAVTFNPDMARNYVRHEKECFIGSAPTLYEVACAYGLRVLEAWLLVHLEYFFKDYLAPRLAEEKVISLDQTKELCELISHHYPTLKVTEYLLFLSYYKAGKFEAKGKFYGYMSPLTFMGNLAEFQKLRALKLSQYERSDTLTRANNRTGISRKEYLRLKALAEAGDEAAKALILQPAAP